VVSSLLKPRDLVTIAVIVDADGQLRPHQSEVNAASDPSAVTVAVTVGALEAAYEAIGLRVVQVKVAETAADQSQSRAVGPDSSVSSSLGLSLLMLRAAALLGASHLCLDAGSTDQMASVLFDGHSHTGSSAPSVVEALVRNSGHTDTGAPPSLSIMIAATKTTTTR
jgi:hypothetical protein